MKIGLEGICRNCERTYFMEPEEIGRLCCICRAHLAYIVKLIVGAA